MKSRNKDTNPKRFPSKPEDKFFGFILLHRRIMENWIWDDPVKLKWWMHILLIVNHSPRKVNIGNKLIECGRGQSIRSIGTWAKEWRVDDSKVRRFFQLLQDDGMIVSESVLKTTRITVCNYDSYNADRRDDEEIATTLRRDDEEIATTNNNDNNVDKGKNDNTDNNGVNVFDGPHKNSMDEKELKEKWIQVHEFIGSKPSSDSWPILKDFLVNYKPLFIEPYLSAWNAVATTYQLTKVKGSSTKRLKNLNDRLKEPMFDFVEILVAIIRSPSLKGNNKKDWAVRFDWVIENDTNYLTIIEESNGSYKSSSAASAYLEQRKKDEAKLAEKLNKQPA